jgi:raffinose/stachyose/melibiose transport system permease protein
VTQSIVLPRRRRLIRPIRPIRHRGSAGYWLYLLPGLAGFLLVIGIPFVMNVTLSFSRWRGTGSPTWIGLQNYRNLLHDDVFWQSFRNNLAMVVAMAIVPTLVGLLIASVLADYVQDKLGTKAASFFRAVYYLPQVLPIAVAGVVWGWILNPNQGALNAFLRDIGLKGFAQNWLGNPHTALPSVMVVMVWLQLGYPIVVFMAGLQRIDPELHEAAELDGASWFQRFRHISIPGIRPEIFVVLLTTTIAALKVFGQIFVLTRGGPDNATMVPSYFAYQNFFEKARVGYGAAISTIMTLIIIVLTAVFIRTQNRAIEAEGSKN